MPPHPLPFSQPSLPDAPRARAAAASALQSDLAFANIYLLRHKYHTELAFEKDALFRHFSGHPRLQGYAFPAGASDPAPALLRIQEDAALRSRPFRFCLLTPGQCDVLRSVFPNVFAFSSDPGDADYVYSRADLASLPGARFHRKRNHIARFAREFPSSHVAPLSSANAADARSVAAAWLQEMQLSAPSPALSHEYEAICHALDSMQTLELFGAVLYVEGAPVAMSIASMISPNVADVHYEKCVPAFRSAYPVINQALASFLSCEFINREEDLNIPGLRQAKLSYFPSLVLSKFNAVPC